MSEKNYNNNVNQQDERSIIMNKINEENKNLVDQENNNTTTNEERNNIVKELDEYLKDLDLICKNLEFEHTEKIISNNKTIEYNTNIVYGINEPSYIISKKDFIKLLKSLKGFRRWHQVVTKILFTIIHTTEFSELKFSEGFEERLLRDL